MQSKFTTPISVAYPPGNQPIFEEWFAQNYKGCNTDRELLPFFPCSYWVNNNYAQDRDAFYEAQEFINRLDRGKKWVIINQYDDGCLVDFKDLDVLRFEMSKKDSVMLPLLCQPHPYKFTGGKKWFCNFVGSKTHPLRDNAEKLKNLDGYFISFEQTPIEAYCKVIYESTFTLCFRGYGLNSFRCAESVQYGSIPVMISDEFILPSWMNFEDFGVLIKAEDAHRIDEILQAIPTSTIIAKQDKLSEAYENFYTFESNMRHIINYLETEYHQREQV